MTIVLLFLFTVALFGVLLFAKKHEMMIANAMNTVLFILLAVACGLTFNSGGSFYLMIIFYHVIPMYAVLAIFSLIKKKQANKQDSYS